MKAPPSICMHSETVVIRCGDPRVKDGEKAAVERGADRATARVSRHDFIVYIARLWGR